MYNPIDHLFLYHGYAHAFGGWVEQDNRYRPVSSVASSVLPLCGGKGSARERDFRFTAKGRKSDFFVSIGEAVTEVDGIVTSEGDEGVYRTTVRSIVDDLTVNDVVHVSHLEAVMESIHPKWTPDERKRGVPKPEAKVRLGMSRIDHMTVDGKSVTVTIDPNIDDFTTYSGMCERMSNAASRMRANMKTQPPYAADLEKIESKTVARGSIVSSVSGKGLDISGTSIDVPDFGRIYVGELFVSHGTRRLNMLRFNLGCDNCGDLAAGSGGINGDTMP